MPNLKRSRSVFDAAQALIPGGVNSPVRAYKAVGGTPPHIASATGAHVTDLDGNEYIDLVLAYGPMILGHAHPEVTSALHEAVSRGTAFGAPTEDELGLAQLITQRVPGCEVVRLVNSGTEATMSAIRLARAATGRDRILKFEGCYHGHGDSFLVQAGSGALTLGAPDSPGVPEALAELTCVAPYNDLDAVRALFKAHGAELAAVIVEPVAGNMGCIPPDPGFLQGLRELCDSHGSLLVYDEVMTGFRVARGGYQDLCPVRADLITLGKVIGGGLPIGAYGGRADLMQKVSPSGDVYQAGTLSGNPIAVAAGTATLSVLDEAGAYESLESSSQRLQGGLERALVDARVPGTVQRQGSMLCLYLRDAAARCLADVTASDRERWVSFFGGMLERGVLLPPSPYEAWFLSTAHDGPVIDRVVEAAAEALRAS